MRKMRERLGEKRERDFAVSKTEGNEGTGTTLSLVRGWSF